MTWIRNASWALCASSLLLAGCVAPQPAATVAPADAAEVAPAPFLAEGVVFLPPSRGQAREVTEVAFVVNATGMRGDIALRLGAQYGVDVPPALADVVAEVRDASDAVVADARLTGAEPQARLQLDALAAGSHRLVLLSYGGSDGEAWGDYVAFAISTALAPRE